MPGELDIPSDGILFVPRGDTLHINPDTGRITGNDAAMQHWEREYEPGWAPEV